MYMLFPVVDLQSEKCAEPTFYDYSVCHYVCFLKALKANLGFFSPSF